MVNGRADSVAAMQIRPATAADREAILTLVPRLAEWGTPPGRDRHQIEQVDLRSIAAALTACAPDSAVLVAEAQARVLGFIHVRTVADYYTQSPIGHVSDVVVAARRRKARAWAWARHCCRPRRTGPARAATG